MIFTCLILLNVWCYCIIPDTALVSPCFDHCMTLFHQSQSWSLMWWSMCSMSSHFCRGKGPFSLVVCTCVLVLIPHTSHSCMTSLLSSLGSGFISITPVLLFCLCFGIWMICSESSYLSPSMRSFGMVLMCVMKLWVWCILILEVLSVFCYYRLCLWSRLCNILVLHPLVMLWIISFPSHEVFVIVLFPSIVKYLFTSWLSFFNFCFCCVSCGVSVTVSLLLCWWFTWCFAIRKDAAKVSDSSIPLSVFVRSVVCTTEFGISNFGRNGIVSTHTHSLSKVTVFYSVQFRSVSMWR